MITIRRLKIIKFYSQSLTYKKAIIKLYMEKLENPIYEIKKNSKYENQKFQNNNKEKEKNRKTIL